MQGRGGCGAFGCLPGAGSGGDGPLWEGPPVQLASKEGLPALGLFRLIKVNSESQGQLRTQVSPGHSKPRPTVPSSWEPQSHTGVWVQVGGAR